MIIKRHDKINDKTWYGIEGYSFFNRLKNNIFYLLMGNYKKFHKEHINTDLGFSLDLTTGMEEIDDDFYFALQCDIHLTDKDGNEIDTIVLSNTFDDIGYDSPVQISERIDDFINEIVNKIESYETYVEENDEEMPF